jgi:hypothetical protein
MYDGAGGVVDGDVVEGVQVVRESGVHSQVGHCQDVQIRDSVDLDCH